MRYAVISLRSSSPEQIERYLPGNYKVVKHVMGNPLTGVPSHDRYDTPCLLIEGEDNAGWTLDEYVLPRLASGLIMGHEVSQFEALRLPDLKGLD